MYLICLINPHIDCLEIWHHQKLPWGCPEVALGFSWGCPGVVLGLPWGCPEVALRLSWGCHEATMRLPWGCPEVALRLLWGCTEDALRFARNCLKHVPWLNCAPMVALRLPWGCLEVVLCSTGISASLLQKLWSFNQAWFQYISWKGDEKGYKEKPVIKKLI